MNNTTIKPSTCDNTRTIELTKGMLTRVSAEDYEYLSQWQWHAAYSKRGNCYYVMRRGSTGGKHKTILMHREVIGAKDGELVDHIDRDPLNNTRDNLRICSASENNFNQGPQKNNKSGFKGVHWHKHVNKWHAQIKAHGRKKHIGYYDDVLEAAKAYNIAALAMHGEFAVLNDVKAVEEAVRSVKAEIERISACGVKRWEPRLAA